MSNGIQKCPGVCLCVQADPKPEIFFTRSTEDLSERNKPEMLERPRDRKHFSQQGTFYDSAINYALVVDVINSSGQDLSSAVFFLRRFSWRWRVLVRREECVTFR